MTEEQDPDLVLLLEIAGRKGDARNDLLTPENVKRAAILNHKNLRGFGTLEQRLVAWPNRSNWRKRVNKVIGEATDKRKKREDAKEAEARLAEAEKNGLSIINFEEPSDVAQDFIEQRRPHIIYAEAEWLDYLHNRYVPLSEREVRTAVQRFLLAGVNSEDGEPCKPNRKVLDDIMDALKGLVFRSYRETEPPTWLDETTGNDDPDPKMVIACRNGLLDTTTGQVLPHTYRFFTRNGLDYDYDEPAYCDAPHRWLAFLKDVWPGNYGQQNIDALQEMMGYLLTGKTSYQKIFMFQGPPGSGKGTISRVINGLLGLPNVAEMSVTKLGKDFGLQALLGKQALIVPDLRLGKDSNIGGITETLLNISGEDRVSIGVKFKDDVQSKLNTRVVLFSNLELLLPDQSGALNRRLFPFVMRKSFYGDKEDSTLGEALQAELPQILTWAVQGLQRLESRKRPDGKPAGFVLTDDAREVLSGLALRTSPVKSFVSAVCDLDPEAMIDKDTLFEAFEGWCLENEVASSYVRDTFGKDLRTASGYNVTPTRLRVGGKGERRHFYKGVRLKPEFEGYVWEQTNDDY